MITIPIQTLPVRTLETPPPEHGYKGSPPLPGDCVHIPATPGATPSPKMETAKNLEEESPDEEMFQAFTSVCDGMADATSCSRKGASIMETATGSQGKQTETVKPSSRGAMGPPPLPTRQSEMAKAFARAKRAREPQNKRNPTNDTQQPHAPTHHQRVNHFVQVAQHPSKSRPSTFSKAHYQDILSSKLSTGVLRKVTPAGQRNFQQLRGEYNPLISDPRHSTAQITRDLDFREMIATARRARKETEDCTARLMQVGSAQKLGLLSSMLGMVMSEQDAEFNQLFDFEEAAAEEVPSSHDQEPDQSQRDIASGKVLNIGADPHSSAPLPNDSGLNMFDDIPVVHLARMESEHRGHSHKRRRIS